MVILLLVHLQAAGSACTGLPAALATWISTLALEHETAVLALWKLAVTDLAYSAPLNSAVV